MQQGALTAAALAQQNNELTGGDDKVDGLKNRALRVAFLKAFAQPNQFDRRPGVGIRHRSALSVYVHWERDLGKKTPLSAD